MSAPTTDSTADSAPAGMPPTADSAPAGMPPTAPAPMHGCVRCGAPVAIEVGLCERCNPLGLRDSSASQVHGLAFIGIVTAIVLMAVVGRWALAGAGPFDASIASVIPDAQGLTISLNVTNGGSRTGQTTCQVTDPADRSGAMGAFMLSPQIDPGQTATFSQRVTALGSTIRHFVVACSAP